MKILITGGAGFIGSHLAEALAANPQVSDITVIDNLATGREQNIRGLPKTTLFKTDIASAYAGMIFNEIKPDVVIHAAASYKDPQDWVTDSRTNVEGTAHIASLAVANKVKRLIYFNTSLCYGLLPPEKPITPTCPLNPQATTYAITKTAGEQILFMSGLDVISFRLANTGGPANLSGPLPTFYKRLTEGKPCFVMDTRRDFIFVGDLVKVVTRAVFGEGRRGVYHISTGKDYSIKELYDAVREALSLPPDPDVKVVPRGADDAETLLIDPTKTQIEFSGWQAGTPLKEWVAKAVEWYKINGVGETYTHLKMKG